MVGIRFPLEKGPFEVLSVRKFGPTMALFHSSSNILKARSSPRCGSEDMKEAARPIKMTLMTFRCNYGARNCIFFLETKLFPVQTLAARWQHGESGTKPWFILAALHAGWKFSDKTVAYRRPAGDLVCFYVVLRCYLQKRFWRVWFVTSKMCKCGAPWHSIHSSQCIIVYG